jgi:hypothetical protein
MKSLSSFLTESTSEEKLTHLEHAEDHHINAGSEGFQHAFNTLHQTHQLLTGKKSEASISTKYDGSPSIVFGYHPENGKFFVASKSAFNATPKLNYTPEDIEKNHGHAPGLVAKLKAALEHLPKVAPRQGVYQGDFMYNKDDGDVREEGNKFHFKPNTITYSTPKGSEEGRKITKSKIGVVVHTAYKGNTLQGMKAEYNANLSNFKEHSDVHLISAEANHQKATYNKQQQQQFLDHMTAAVNSHGSLKNYKHHEGHVDHIKTYINSTVRNGTSPSVEGYKQHLTKHYQTKANALKTPSGKQRQLETGAQMTAYVDKHEKKFQSTFNTHAHLQAAKNVLVNALASNPRYEHYVGGQKVKPEGHVVVINNRPTKLVDRDEFSRMNFQART